MTAGTGSSIRPDDPRDVVVAFVDAVNGQDWPGVEALVAPAFARHSDAGGDVDGSEELIAFLQGEYASFPDAHEELETVIAEGDLVAARHLFTGTQDGPLGDHPPTGRCVPATSRCTASSTGRSSRRGPSGTTSPGSPSSGWSKAERSSEDGYSEPVPAR